MDSELFPRDLSSIGKCINHFRSKKLPYAFWIGFENEPSALEAELQKLGLITDEMEWAMVSDLNNYQKEIDMDHFNIKKVRNREGIRDLVHLIDGAETRSFRAGRKRRSLCQTKVKMSPSRPKLKCHHPGTRGF